MVSVSVYQQLIRDGQRECKNYILFSYFLLLKASGMQNSDVGRQTQHVKVDRFIIRVRVYKFLEIFESNKKIENTWLQTRQTTGVLGRVSNHRIYVRFKMA